MYVATRLSHPSGDWVIDVVANRLDVLDVLVGSGHKDREKLRLQLILWQRINEDHNLEHIEMQVARNM